jgi:seryl-tRNA synthetase
MIDLKAARNDPETFRVALERRGAADAFNELIAADERWRALVPRVDELRAQQKLDGKPSPEQLEQLRRVKEELKGLEDELAAAEANRDAALAKVPNLPHESAADGFRDEDAIVVKEWGERRTPQPPLEHLEIGNYDMERGAKVSGARFGFIIGDAARLSLALYRLALDRLIESGFTPVLPPVLVREEAMYGTGFFPSEKNDYYSVPEDGLYLVGTSEVPLIAMHIGEILDELPIRYGAFSSCFRREAGAAGKDTRGMFRVHQFQKVEMVVYTRPEDSWDEHERLLAFEEALVQEVGLPYRVVNSAAGDLSSAAAKRYDIEAWFPPQDRYREITSCSNTTDFQARRSGIRFRAGEKQLETPHTLNGTAVTDRWALAILENFGGDVPEVLQRYGAPARVSK